MEPGRVWDETAWRFHCGSEEEGNGKVYGATNRKGGQNFSIERILGQVQSAHLGEGGEAGREVDQGEEGEDFGQGDGEGEGDIEEEDEVEQPAPCCLLPASLPSTPMLPCSPAPLPPALL